MLGALCSLARCTCCHVVAGPPGGNGPCKEWFDQGRKVQGEAIEVSEGKGESGRKSQRGNVQVPGFSEGSWKNAG